MSDQRLDEALPSYEIGGELGRGAMGEVYAGRHTRLDRDVAIKQLPEGFARDETVRARFGDEARVLASLTHPHIVPVYDYVEEEGLCLLVMEALPGGTVWDRFTAEGISMPTACAVVLATCAGLAHAHERRVLHRDVKPENLMFDAENTLKVTDFGIATVLGGDESLATADGEIIGTPAYMAPEQAEGGDIGPAADVYAVGTMLYELLSGRLPFDESGDAMDLLRARTTQEPQPLDEVAPHVPAPLVAATMRSIARRPEDRYPGPEEMGVAVAHAAATAWGSDWRSRAELKLMTTGPIAEAASTPTIAASTAPDSVARPDGPEARGTVGPGEAPTSEGAGRATVAPGDVSEVDAGARGTVAPGAADELDADPRETVAPGGLDGGGGDTGARGTAMAGQADDPDRVVMPSEGAGDGGRRPAGADLVDAAPEDLVQVSDVLTPPEVPWLPIVAALVFAVVAVLVGLTGLGEPDHAGDGLTIEQLTVAGADVAAEQPVEVDLAEPVPIIVSDPPPAAAESELALSAMGIPLGTSSAAPVQSGPEGILTFPSATALRLVPSGPVTAELRLLDEGGAVVASQEFGLDPDRAGYLSAGGVIAIVLVLLVLAYGSSSSARLRKGRQDRLAYPKLAVVGALGGVALTLLGWSFAGAELTAVTMIVAAGLGAVAAVFAGRAAFGLGRRRRLRRASPSS